MNSNNFDLKQYGFKITQPRVEILKLFEEIPTGTLVLMMFFLSSNLKEVVQA